MFVVVSAVCAYTLHRSTTNICKSWSTGWSKNDILFFVESNRYLLAVTLHRSTTNICKSWSTGWSKNDIIFCGIEPLFTGSNNS